jgi:hypothetical protein
MVNGESLRCGGSSSNKKESKANYDYLKEIIKIAKKNGWELESLELVPKDLPALPATHLTKKEIQQRNRCVKNVLKRFCDLLTPPVPRDLEQSLRLKTEKLLPWEEEAIEKIDKWRKDVKRLKPEILKELHRIWQSG